jgi:MFS family permease
LLGIMLIGGGAGVVFPIMISLISRQFPEDSSGAAVGSYETSFSMGETGGPYLAGVLASLTSIRYSFLIFSILGVIMALFAANGRTYSSDLGRNLRSVEFPHQLHNPRDPLSRD